MTDPLILTLQFDAVTADLFERHRQTFFPERLNQVPAHLTLFHKLPGAQREAVVREVARAASRPPFPVTVTGVMGLGRGVAYALASQTLLSLRADLARAFAPWLTAQDREAFRPHVTIQNKVSPGEARRTKELLARTFAPFEARAEGIQLWHYRGGPWEGAGAIAFTG